MHQIKIEVSSFHFKCLDKGIYSAEKLMEIRNSRCDKCSLCWSGGMYDKNNNRRWN
jgi:hypothetical protein